MLHLIQRICKTLTRSSAEVAKFFAPSILRIVDAVQAQRLISRKSISVRPTATTVLTYNVILLLVDCLPRRGILFEPVALQEAAACLNGPRDIAVQSGWSRVCIITLRHSHLLTGDSQSEVRCPWGPVVLPGSLRFCPHDALCVRHELRHRI